MSPSTAPGELYNSPKRKRGAPDSIEYSPWDTEGTPHMARDSLEHGSLHESIEPPGQSRERSPSSRVMGQLRNLDLQGTFIKQISFTDTGRTRSRFSEPGEEPVVNHVTGRDSGEDRSASSKSDGTHTVTSEISSLELQTTQSSSSTAKRARDYDGSPTLEGDPKDNATTWHKSEITGHKPTDPNDDGYGINGIGFKPTPAVAWARYQKRKQQLADYKSREAREARQRRSERRRAESREMSPERAEMVKKRRAKVRFGDANGEQVSIN